MDKPTTRTYGTWVKDICDICGEAFQVTRTEPRTITGELMCGECEMYRRGQKDAQPQWQPIETAPKDRSVLLWLGNPWNKVELAWWFEPWGLWVTENPDDLYGEIFGIGRKVPTHWMELPEPPKEQPNG